MNKTATIILNRNLPKETDALVEHLKRYDGDYTDIFVVEAGSDKDKLSKYFTWHVTTTKAVKHGLRYSRGMNYGLLQLFKLGYWNRYDSFFLITNDTKFGIGTSTPASKLHIKSTDATTLYIESTTSDNNGLVILNANTGSNWNVNSSLKNMH